MSTTSRSSALLQLVLAAFLLPCFAATHARAASTPSVVLDSVAKSHAYARAQAAKAEAQGRKIEAVTLLHIGDDTPTELSALAEWFAAKGIKVEYKRVSREEFDAALDAVDHATEEDYKSAVRLIRYETKPNDNYNDEQAMELLAAAKKERLASLKHFFGVPLGVTFASYKMKRNAKEKLVEGGVALGKGAINSTVLYYSLLSRLEAGDHLNLPLGIAVSAAFGIGFDYWQRGNSAFKGQGTSFNPEPKDPAKGSFAMNRKFYLLAAFLHSVAMRGAIMVAAHMTGAGFVVGWADGISVVATSLLGLVGKAPVEMWIERMRRTHSKAWTIGVMTAWGLAYSALQFAAQFNVQSFFGMATGELFRYTLGALGGIGMIFEVLKEWKPIAASFRRMRNWALAINTRKTCETLLTLKLSDPPPSEATP